MTDEPLPIHWTNLIPRHLNPTDLVKPNYTGQMDRYMPLYLWINSARHTVSVHIWNYAVDGILINERNGIVRSYRLPTDLDATCLHAAVDAILLQLGPETDTFEYFGQALGAVVATLPRIPLFDDISV